jgi:hypothetical protein
MGSEEPMKRNSGLHESEGLFILKDMHGGSEENQETDQSG